METEKKNLWKSTIITFLVLIGIAVTIDLAYIYYQANFNAHALPSFCSINDFIDCDGVARTPESQFFGVPLAYWGLFLYSFILMLLFVDKLKKLPFLKFLEVFKNKYHYIASLGLISFIISMILLGVSYFDIHKLCIMCLLTYIIDLFIGIAAVWGIKQNFWGAIKQSWIDFVDALKPIPYRIAFIVVMIIACGFLGWAYTSAQFSPALKWQRSIGEFVKLKSNIYAVKGNVLGSPDKNAVVLEVYSDYQCPICHTSNVIIHKVVRDFKNVRVEHHNVPLDRACNKYMKGEFHIGSCICAQYGLAAKKQGKFWEVESLLFEKTPTTEEDILKTLRNSNISLDMDKLQKDANSAAVKKSIQDDIDFAFSHGMVGTPSMRIDGDFEMGMKGYTELKEWIKKHGGQPKHYFFN